MRGIGGGRMGGIFAAVLLAASGATAAPSFRAAVVAPEGAGDEFRTALKTLKWKADAYDAAPKGWERLGKKLGGYDVVLAGPGGLAGLGQDTAKTLPGFMEAGGAVVATGIVASNDVAWLAALDPSYAVSVAVPDPAKTKPAERIDTDGNTTLLSWPEWAIFPAAPVAAQFAFSGQNGRAWETAGRVGREPCVLLKRFGRGFLVLTTAKDADAAFLGNIAKALELQRMGLACRGISHKFKEDGFEIGRLALGGGETRVALRNTSGTNISVRATLSVAGPSSSREFYGSGEQKQANNFDIGIPVRMDMHGRVSAELWVENMGTGAKANLASFTETLPELLEVVPPAYRGMISTARRDPAVHFGLRLNPVAENVEGLKIGVWVSSPDGKILATGDVVATGSGFIPAALPLAADAPAGDYTLHASATLDGLFPLTSETAFKIVPVRPGQLFIDQDNVALREGKPFFPLGLYHAGGWLIDEWLDLGVNLVQCWNWDWNDNYVGDSGSIKASSNAVARAAAAAEHLEKLTQAGVGIIYERGEIWGELVVNGQNPWKESLGYQFENAETREALRTVLNHPSHRLAAWYLADEVSGRGWVETLQRAAKVFHDLDDDHPVFNLSAGDPSVAPGGDIAAFDCYPKYGLHGDVTKGRPFTAVSDTVDAFRAYTRFRQPVWVVPQAFGEDNNHGEKPEWVRAMSYLAITHGANGILWYCWKEIGDWTGARKQGMGWNPPTAAVVKAMIAEIKVFDEALMEPGARTLKSDNGRVHAILCGSEKTGRFLVYVNGEVEPTESALDLPELKGAKLEPLFGGPSAKVRDGKVSLKLPALATGAFRVTDK